MDMLAMWILVLISLFIAVRTTWRNHWWVPRLSEQTSIFTWEIGSQAFFCVLLSLLSGRRKCNLDVFNRRAINYFKEKFIHKCSLGVLHENLTELIRTERFSLGNLFFSSYMQLQKYTLLYSIYFHYIKSSKTNF